MTSEIIKVGSSSSPSKLLTMESSHCANGSYNIQQTTPPIGGSNSVPSTPQRWNKKSDSNNTSFESNTSIKGTGSKISNSVPSTPLKSTFKSSSSSLSLSSPANTINTTNTTTTTLSTPLKSSSFKLSSSGTTVTTTASTPSSSKEVDKDSQQCATGPNRLPTNLLSFWANNSVSTASVNGSSSSPNTSLDLQSGKRGVNTSNISTYNDNIKSNSLRGTRTSIPYNNNNDNSTRSVRSFMSLQNQPNNTNNDNSVRSTRSYVPSTSESPATPTFKTKTNNIVSNTPSSSSLTSTSTRNDNTTATPSLAERKASLLLNNSTISNSSNNTKNMNHSIVSRSTFYSTTSSEKAAVDSIKPKALFSSPNHNKSIHNVNNLASHQDNSFVIVSSPNSVKTASTNKSASLSTSTLPSSSPTTTPSPKSELVRQHHQLLMQKLGLENNEQKSKDAQQQQRRQTTGARTSELSPSRWGTDIVTNNDIGTKIKQNKLTPDKKQLLNTNNYLNRSLQDDIYGETNDMKHYTIKNNTSMLNRSVPDMKEMNHNDNNHVFGGRQKTAGTLYYLNNHNNHNNNVDHSNNKYPPIQITRSHSLSSRSTVSAISFDAATMSQQQQQSGGSRTMPTVHQPASPSGSGGEMIDDDHHVTNNTNNTDIVTVTSRREKILKKFQQINNNTSPSSSKVNSNNTTKANNKTSTSSSIGTNNSSSTSSSKKNANRSHASLPLATLAVQKMAEDSKSDGSNSSKNKWKLSSSSPREISVGKMNNSSHRNESNQHHNNNAIDNDVSFLSADDSFDSTTEKDIIEGEKKINDGSAAVYYNRKTHEPLGRSNTEEGNISSFHSVASMNSNQYHHNNPHQQQQHLLTDEYEDHHADESFLMCQPSSDTADVDNPIDDEIVFTFGMKHSNTSGEGSEYEEQTISTTRGRPIDADGQHLSFHSYTATSGNVNNDDEMRGGISSRGLLNQSLNRPEDLDRLNVTSICSEDFSYDHVLTLGQDENDDVDASFKLYSIADEQRQQQRQLRTSFGIASPNKGSLVDKYIGSGEPATSARSYHSSDVFSGSLHLATTEQEESMRTAQQDEVDDVLGPDERTDQSPALLNQYSDGTNGYITELDAPEEDDADAESDEGNRPSREESRNDGYNHDAATEEAVARMMADVSFLKMRPPSQSTLSSGFHERKIRQLKTGGRNGRYAPRRIRDDDYEDYNHETSNPNQGDEFNFSNDTERILVNVISAATEAVQENNEQGRIGQLHHFDDDDSAEIVHARNVSSNNHSLTSDRSGRKNQVRSKQNDVDDEESDESSASRLKRDGSKGKKTRRDTNRDENNSSPSFDDEESVPDDKDEDINRFLLGALIDFVLPADEGSVCTVETDSSHSMARMKSGSRRDSKRTSYNRSSRGRGRERQTQDDPTKPSSLSRLHEWWQTETTNAVMQDPAINGRSEDSDEDIITSPKLEGLINDELQRVLKGEVIPLWGVNPMTRTTSLLTTDTASQLNAEKDLDELISVLTDKSSFEHERKVNSMFEEWVTKWSRVLEDAQPCGASQAVNFEESYRNLRKNVNIEESYKNIQRGVESFDVKFSKTFDMQAALMAKDFQALLPKIRTDMSDRYSSKHDFSPDNSFSDFTESSGLIDRTKEAHDAEVEMTWKDHNLKAKLTPVLESANEDVASGDYERDLDIAVSTTMSYNDNEEEPNDSLDRFLSGEDVSVQSSKSGSYPVGEFLLDPESSDPCDDMSNSVSLPYDLNRPWPPIVSGNSSLAPSETTDDSSTSSSVKKSRSFARNKRKGRSIIRVESTDTKSVQSIVLYPVNDVIIEDTSSASEESCADKKASKSKRYDSQFPIEDEPKVDCEREDTEQVAEEQKDDRNDPPMSDLYHVSTVVTKDSEDVVDESTLEIPTAQEQKMLHTPTIKASLMEDVSVVDSCSVDNTNLTSLENQSVHKCQSNILTPGVYIATEIEIETAIVLSDRQKDDHNTLLLDDGLIIDKSSNFENSDIFSDASSQASCKWEDVGPSVFSDWKRKKRNTPSALKKLGKLKILRNRFSSSGNQEKLASMDQLDERNNDSEEQDDFNANGCEDDMFNFGTRNKDIVDDKGKSRQILATQSMDSDIASSTGESVSSKIEQCHSMDESAIRINSARYRRLQRRGDFSVTSNGSEKKQAVNSNDGSTTSFKETEFLSDTPRLVSSIVISRNGSDALLHKTVPPPPPPPLPSMRYTPEICEAKSKIVSDLNQQPDDWEDFTATGASFTNVLPAISKSPTPVSESGNEYISQFDTFIVGETNDDNLAEC